MSLRLSTKFLLSLISLDATHVLIWSRRRWRTRRRRRRREGVRAEEAERERKRERDAGTGLQQVLMETELKQTLPLAERDAISDSHTPPSQLLFGWERRCRVGTGEVSEVSPPRLRPSSEHSDGRQNLAGSALTNLQLFNLFLEVGFIFLLLVCVGCIVKLRRRKKRAQIPISLGEDSHLGRAVQQSWLTFCQMSSNCSTPSPTFFRHRSISPAEKRTAIPSK